MWPRHRFESCTGRLAGPPVRSQALPEGYPSVTGIARRATRNVTATGDSGHGWPPNTAIRRREFPGNRRVADRGGVVDIPWGVTGLPVGDGLWGVRIPRRGCGCAVRGGRRSRRGALSGETSIEHGRRHTARGVETEPLVICRPLSDNPSLTYSWLNLVGQGPVEPKVPRSNRGE